MTHDQNKWNKISLYDVLKEMVNFKRMIELILVYYNSYLLTSINLVLFWHDKTSFTTLGFTAICKMVSGGTIISNHLPCRLMFLGGFYAFFYSYIYWIIAHEVWIEIQAFPILNLGPICMMPFFRNTKIYSKAVSFDPSDVPVLKVQYMSDEN